jgi:hypothetical protein
MKQMLDSSFQEHCLQPQNEVTEWLNMYCEIFQNFVERHCKGFGRMLQNIGLTSIELQNKRSSFEDPCESKLNST